MRGMAIGGAGFRAFGELLRHLAGRNVIELVEGSAKGDPEVSLPVHGGETKAFALLRSVVADQQAKGTEPHLLGLKNKVRKVQPGYSREKTFGYGGFLQFAKAAATQGVITLRVGPRRRGLRAGRAGGLNARVRGR